MFCLLCLFLLLAVQHLCGVRDAALFYTQHCSSDYHGKEDFLPLMLIHTEKLLALGKQVVDKLLSVH